MALDDAYARLGMDPLAHGAERLALWAAWRGPEERLGAPERRALARALREFKRHKDDGGDCMEHIALAPARQLELLRLWRERALHWSSLSLSLQRGMMRQGKEIVNACCVRRRRDAWKWRCRAYLQELALCVELAEREVAALWRSDVNHRVLLELVLAAPLRLAAPLQRSLPCLPDVRFSLRGVYERAVVCLLRALQREPLLALELKLLGRHVRDYGEYECRVLGHLVRLASPNAADVLLALLQQPLGRVLDKKTGARIVKDCLLRARGGALGALQAQLAAQVLPLLSRTRPNELTEQIRSLAREALAAAEAASAPAEEAAPAAEPPEEALAPRACAWDHAPDAESSEPVAHEQARFAWPGAEPPAARGPAPTPRPVLLWCHRLQGARRHFYFFTPLSAQS
jgi:hypothetical protein